MTTCTRCGFEASRMFQCEHTGGREMCQECYQEIHWLLTSKKD